MVIQELVAKVEMSRLLMLVRYQSYKVPGECYCNCEDIDLAVWRCSLDLKVALVLNKIYSWLGSTLVIAIVESNTGWRYE